MNKKQLKQCYKMNMGHFLRDYYGVSNERLILELCNLSHKDLKKVASLYGIDLVRTNFDLISMDQILTGSIVLVTDAFGNFAPYVNPNRVLSWNYEFDTELDLSYVNTIVEEVKFDKKGRQKSLKRVIKLGRNDKND